MSLSRQAEELSALAAMYCGDDETFTIEEEDASGELCCRLSLHDGAASLGAALPGDYPTLVPPRLTVSCPSLSAAESRALFASLVEIAADGAAADREILFEVCQAFQERMAELLATPDAPVEEVHQPAPAEQQGRAAFLVWFHHIKSMSKRKDIVGWARDGGLRGFCKPGFPGVLAVEGEAAACAEYVARLRELRWHCLLYTSPSPRDGLLSRMPSSA